MATTKPRLSVTLSPESRAALERLTAVSGVAASQFISGLVHDAIPIIEATAKALEVAKSQPQKAADVLNEQLVRTLAKATQGQLELDQAIQERKLRKRPRKS
jgi:hypothetical protein